MSAYNRIKPVAHIGWNVVCYGNATSMEVLQSHFEDNGAAFPAQSITIHSTESITNLRNFCNVLLAEVEKPTT